MQTLLFQLNQVVNLSENLSNYLQNTVRKEEFPRNYLLLEEGKIQNRIYFITRGSARSYYYEKGKTITASFYRENDFIANSLSFKMQKQSAESIELIEPCTLLSLSYSELQYVYATFPESNLISRIMTEKYQQLQEEQTRIIRINNAGEKLQQLMKQDPNLFLRTPLGYIASYLGMTQETLSRMRGRRSRLIV